MSIPEGLQLARCFAFAQRSTALLETCCPLNLDAELERLGAAWDAGQEARPRWCYRRPPELSDLRARLVAVADAVGNQSALGRLYAERALELELEAALCEAIGTPRVRALGARRYGAVDPAADSLAAEWLSTWQGAGKGSGHRAARLPGHSAADEADEPGDAASAAEQIVSDDRADRRSLLSQLLRELDRERLAARVVVSAALHASAAAGAGVVIVRAGVRHSEREARRIVVHEVHGHLLPLERARRQPSPIFIAGTRGGLDDQEGRALCLEERRGLSSGERRAELALRHLAAGAVRQGAEWVDLVRMLRRAGARARRAVALAARAQRGGGLGRELVYLPAMLRVRAACARSAEVERFLERGSVSVDAVPTLRACGSEPDRSAGCARSQPAPF